MVVASSPEVTEIGNFLFIIIIIIILILIIIIINCINLINRIIQINRALFKVESNSVAIENKLH